MNKLIIEQLQQEVERLNDTLQHAYQKSNIAVKGYYDMKQRCEHLQEENDKMKELLSTLMDNNIVDKKREVE